MIFTFQFVATAGYPLMFSLFSFARCVFWSVGHQMAEYWGNWSPGSAGISEISWRGEIDPRLDRQRGRLLSMWHHASILMVCQILVPVAPIKRKAHIKGGIASRQQLFQRFFLQRRERGEDDRIGSFAYFAGNGSCPEAKLSVSPLFRKRKPNSRIPFSISLNKQSYPNMKS